MYDERLRSLRVPCCYQGGKQRISKELVDVMLEGRSSAEVDGLRFFDLCCGTGAITVELIRRGVSPEHITMLDASSWGAFWAAVGGGTFDMLFFAELLKSIPKDKREVKRFMSELATRPVEGHEAEIYIVLQSCSFGGKQIWCEDDRWKNAFFRDYWIPKPGSVRKSPANPMQPAPETLYRRVKDLQALCRGVTCIRDDIGKVFEVDIPSDSIVYVDPPYKSTTGYAYAFDIQEFVNAYLERYSAPLFVSEGHPLSEAATTLSLGGAKGGISGVRLGRQEEWLTKFTPIT